MCILEIPPQPEECPTCMLRFPLEADRITLQPCCGFIQCKACSESDFYVSILENVKLKCPNCEGSTEPGELLIARNKLVGKIGGLLFDGNCHDLESGIACYTLALWYQQKDPEKAMQLLARGSKLGNPLCLYDLGMMRKREDKKDSVQYFLKSACAGYQLALDEVKRCYMERRVTNDKYADALRSFQSVSDEIESVSRTRFNKRLADGQTKEDIAGDPEAIWKIILQDFSAHLEHLESEVSV